jgi:hypothetical protein
VSVKAKLTITLKADETVVAETEDAGLWQRVLIAINKGSHDLAEGYEKQRSPESGVEEQGGGRRASDAGGDAVERFATQLGVRREELEGACAPSEEEPFLHLDVHCWEEFKRQVPSAGRAAMSPIVLAATLLTLWFRAAGLGNPTQAQAQGVLRTIGVEDKNPSRGIQRAEWLQSRPGGAILLNPAQVSRAFGIAKAFCTKQWKPEISK